MFYYVFHEMLTYKYFHSCLFFLFQNINNCFININMGKLQRVERKFIFTKTQHSIGIQGVLFISNKSKKITNFISNLILLLLEIKKKKCLYVEIFQIENICCS